MAFVLSLFVPHLSFFWCSGKTELLLLVYLFLFLLFVCLFVVFYIFFQSGTSFKSFLKMMLYITSKGEHSLVTVGAVRVKAYRVSDYCI